MPLKRYSSPCKKITVNVKIDGKQVGIVFDRYNHDSKTRFVDVSDKNIQSQLEASPDFTVYFHLDYTIADPIEVIPIEAKPIEVVKPVVPVIEAKKEVPTKEVKEFPNITKAKEWINKDHGVAYSKMANVEKVTSEYNKLGFDLKITIVKK
jgi:hypothetical protein